MSFNEEEREYLKTCLNEKVSVQNLSEYLPEETYEFIKSKHRLSTVTDQIIYFEKSPVRPYESFRLTKFITPDFSINTFIDDISASISGQYLIFIDCHFLILCPSDDDNTIVLKFQQGSKASSFNDVMKVVDQEDHSSFMKQFKDLTPPDVLNECFNSHVDLFDYRGSGLRPHSLLAVLINVQKIM